MREWRFAKIRELDSEGLTQAEIGQQLQCSQQLVSYCLKKIREQDRLELERTHEELAYTYRVTLDNLRKIRKELWNDLKQTTDKRTKTSFYHELQEVNLKIMELASSNDIILATVKNAERIAKEAKRDLDRVKHQRLEEEMQMSTNNFRDTVSLDESKREDEEELEEEDEEIVEEGDEELLEDEEEEVYTGESSSK